MSPPAPLKNAAQAFVQTWLQVRGGAWRLAAGLGIGGVALWLAARDTEISTLREAVGRANPAWLLAAVASVVITVAAGVVRWRVLFYPEASRRSWWALTAAFIVGQMLNIVLPLRVGEVVRAGWASRAEQVPVGRVLGTIALERLADLVAVGTVTLTLLMLAAVPGWLAAPGRALIATAGVALAVIVVLAWRSQSLAGLAASVSRRLPRSIGTRAERLLIGALEGTRVLESGKVSAGVGVLSVVVLMLAASTNYLLFAAFDLTVPPAAALVLVIALQVGNTLASVPGNVGVFHYVTVLTLGAYGVDRDAAFPYAVALHVVALVPKIVVGGTLLALARPRTRAAGTC